jgi:hypothetical protein
MAIRADKYAFAKFLGESANPLNRSLPASVDWEPDQLSQKSDKVLEVPARQRGRTG